MKYLTFYKTALNCNTEDQIFDFLINNLQKSISDWSFFVDWKKIQENIAKIEIELNILNSLLGKDNLEKKFLNTLIEYPKIRNALPILVAVRNQKLKEMPILNNGKSLDFEIKDYVFNIKTRINHKIKNELIRFFIESGLKGIFQDKAIKNLVDYCFGVEVGMDTNARKNRGGQNMESIIEVFIKNVCEKNNFKYLKEVNAEKIKNELGYDVPIDKSSRRYDFVIDNGKELFIIETNFYGGDRKSVV